MTTKGAGRKNAGRKSEADHEEWFRAKDFRTDVLRYLYRQRIMDYQTLAARTDIRPEVLSAALRPDGTVTLRTLGALAALCDLDLNTYVLTQSQHDAYMDAKHTTRKIRRKDQANDEATSE